MFDLDGVVYVDGRLVEHAAESIAAAREEGAHVAFITNNASRTPEQVSSNLSALGVAASRDDVVTSSQAAARLLREAHGEGAAIACLGTDGLVGALREAGLEPVEVGDERAVAIVSGYAPDIRWRVIMRAATLIRNGLPWTASNTDRTLPTGDGLAPGHGLLVRLISDFAGVEPVVAGKPARPVLDRRRRRVDGEHRLMVGDRLDTDISGAHNAEVDSLVVMTGVTSLADLVTASPEQRPTWIGHDLTALGRPGVRASRRDAGWEAGGWSVGIDGGQIAVDGGGRPDGWWTAVAVAGWEYLDRTGHAIDVSGLTAPGSEAASG